MRIPGAKRIARRMMAALPPRVKARVKNSSTRLQFARNTAGLAPDATMTRWASENSKPVSIVIPSYNDFPFLIACLESLSNTIGEFEHEIIVVDDYCQPDNSERLRTLESERVRVIFKPERVGFAGSVNLGMAHARYDIVLLNSDIVAQPGWLEALQFSAYEIDGAIGLVSPKLLYPNGLIQYGGTYYARVLAPQWFGHLHVGSQATRPVTTVPAYNRSVSGACVYITRAAYERLGPLDDQFWLGFEDVDWGLRAWELGIRCYYQPASILVHHESASRGYSQGKRELSSMRYFWRRWQHLFLTRAIVGVPDVDFILSERSSGLWQNYIDDLARRLTNVGHTVAVHRMSSGAPDEELIAELAARSSLKVCCDWGADETTWLAALESGKPVYLLPSVESSSFPLDPALQTYIVAHYKPEFDYIAPNRHVADQLRAETAWEARSRVVPAMTNPVGAVRDGHAIVTLGATAEERDLVDTYAQENSFVARHFEAADPTETVLAEISTTSPRAIVATPDYQNSLAVLALMSTGAAVISRHNDKLRYEILDGYNVLLVEPGSRSDLVRALTDIMTDDAIKQELSENGLATTERLLETNTVEMSRALFAIAANAV